MNMLKKLLIISGFSAVATIIITAPTFATIEHCINYYPNLTTETDNSNYPVRCVKIYDNTAEKEVVFYAKTAADCASASSIAANQDTCGGKTFNDSDEALEKFQTCVGEGKKYPNLSLQDDDETYPIKCPSVRYGEGAYITFRAKKSADCATASTLASNPDSCDETDISSGSGQTTGSEDDQKENTKKEETKKSSSNKNDAPTVIVMIISIVSIVLAVAIIGLTVVSFKK